MREWDLKTGPRGLTLRICEWGPPEARPLLVLHGFLEQGAAWRDVALSLPHRRIIAPDARGHGLTEHVGTGGWYHFWDYVSDAEAIVDHLGSPIDLLGHSMGGGVASILAGARPEKVRRLMVIEGLGPPVPSSALRLGQHYLRDRSRSLEHRPLEDLTAASARLVKANPRLTPDLAEFLAERTTVPGPEGLTWSWDPLHRGRYPTPFSFEAYGSFLEAIQAPTLLTYGANTPYKMQDLPAREALISGHRRVVVPDAGHMIHYDQPVALARLIAEHFDES